MPVPYAVTQSGVVHPMTNGSSSCTFLRYLAFLVLLGLVNAIPLLRLRRSTGLSEQVLAALPPSNSKKSFFAIGAFTSMDEDEMAVSRAGRSVDTVFIDYTF
uniref:Dirigent protein n=1 Tax=Steinernema glaseri TaxID=37863 RepID=A0A1I8AAP1_9BILA